MSSADVWKYRNSVLGHEDCLAANSKSLWRYDVANQQFANSTMFSDFKNFVTFFLFVWNIIM